MIDDRNLQVTSCTKFIFSRDALRRTVFQVSTHHNKSFVFSVFSVISVFLPPATIRSQQGRRAYPCRRRWK